MKLENLVNTNPVTTTQSANLQDASEMMQKKHVGSLLVLEDYDAEQPQKLCGIITDRDVSLALTVNSHPGNVLVESVMMSQPVAMNKKSSLLEVSATMKKYSVKRMPIVNDDGSLFGIITADDLLGIFSQQISNLAAITRQQIVKESGANLPFIPFKRAQNRNNIFRQDPRI